MKLHWQTVRGDGQYTRYYDVSYLVVPRPRLGEDPATGRRWVYYVYELHARSTDDARWSSVEFYPSMKAAKSAAQSMPTQLGFGA